MKLPSAKDYDGKELHFGEETYTVHVVAKVPEPDAVGLFDPSEHKIYLKRGQTRAQLFRTAIHEGLHAIEEEYGPDLTEEEIGKLEKGIADFLLMNF